MSLSSTRFGGNAFGLPAPAPLPSLKDALARRASVFGPVEVDPEPVRPRGLRQSFAAVLRDLAEILEPAVAL
ncbi:hypothetical protein I3A86_25300 [Salmonella enterica]|nr:hypothetical protein [Salmonella enterica]